MGTIGEMLGAEAVEQIHRSVGERRMQLATQVAVAKRASWDQWMREFIEKNQEMRFWHGTSSGLLCSFRPSVQKAIVKELFQ